MEYLVIYWYWQDNAKVPCAIESFTNPSDIDEAVQAHAEYADIKYNGYFATTHQYILEN